jgi:hypothetical protein
VLILRDRRKNYFSIIVLFERIVQTILRITACTVNIAVRVGFTHVLPGRSSDNKTTQKCRHRHIETPCGADDPIYRTYSLVLRKKKKKKKTEKILIFTPVYVPPYCEGLWVICVYVCV